MFKNMYLEMSQNIPKCLNMSNGQKCLKNIEKNCPKIKKNIRECPKCPNNVQKCPKNVQKY